MRKRKYEMFSAESQQGLAEEKELDAHVIECDAFFLHGLEHRDGYLTSKDFLLSDFNHYANYNEYVYTVNLLNACLKGHLPAIEKWMQKLKYARKDCTFVITVNFAGVPFNPFCERQVMDGRIDKSLFEIVEGYWSISPFMKELILNAFCGTFLDQNRANRP